MNEWDKGWDKGWEPVRATVWAGREDMTWGFIRSHISNQDYNLILGNINGAYRHMVRGFNHVIQNVLPHHLIRATLVEEVSHIRRMQRISRERVDD